MCKCHTGKATIFVLLHVFGVLNVFIIFRPTKHVGFDTA